jgi:hypothetical protein
MSPPQNVNEALTRGGIPQHWTADMLEWLEVKHKDLASRGLPGPKNNSATDVAELKRTPSQVAGQLLGKKA